MNSDMTKKTSMRWKGLSRIAVVLLLSCSSPDHVRDAQAAYERGEFEETVRFTSLAIEENESHREARSLLAQAHRKLADEATNEGELMAALEHRVQAANSEPSRAKRAEDALKAVKEAMDLSQSETALQMAALSVEANPASMEGRRLLASLLDEANEFSRAVTHYLWIWEADRSQIPVGLRLAFIYGQLERFTDAEAVYARVLEKDPENVQATLGRAEALEKNKRSAAADGIYRELIRKHPENAGLMFRYADFIERQGDPSHAEELRARARGELPKTQKRNLRKLPPSRR